MHITSPSDFKPASGPTVWGRAALASAMVFAGALLATPRPVHAQEYPNKPVTIVVPAQPGGGFDLVGRMVAEALGKQVSKPFVVENKQGSGTLVGTQFAAAAPADGYTLMVGGQSNMVFNPVLYKAIRYDARNDFTNLGLVATYPYVMVARADLPVRTYKELFELIKSRPDSVTIATAGAGGTPHILAAAFAKAIDGKVTIVHYRGAVSAYQDIVGGRVDLFIDALPTVRSQLAGGRVKPLLMTGTARLASLPDVPTVRELGLPSLEIESWFGIFAQAKTPAPVLQWLRAGLAEATRTPEWKARLERSGIEPMSMSLQEADRFLAADYQKWTEFVRREGITAD